jgi:hypothetical protein
MTPPGWRRLLGLRLVLFIIAVGVLVVQVLPPLGAFIAGQRSLADITIFHRLLLVGVALFGAWDPVRNRACVWIVMAWAGASVILSSIGPWEITNWTGVAAVALLALLVTYPSQNRRPPEPPSPPQEPQS